MIQRRSFLISGCLAAAGAALPLRLHAATSQRLHTLSQSLEQLEKSSGGRLGVAVSDTGSGETVGHRAGERFAMCSTFKMLLASAVLRRARAGSEHLDRQVAVPPLPLIGNSPLTEPHAGGTMSVSDLCFATLTRSDNTAANLLLAIIGGPAGLTQFARSLGDTVTRLDRTETSLNEAAPGDPRDTTTPSAMLEDLRRLLVGSALAPPDREQLKQWMVANKTGDERLRAALPQGWIAADKTGSNGYTTSNDIAVFWPPKQPPVLVTAYLTECPGPETRRSTVLAQVGRQVIAALQSQT